MSHRRRKHKQRRQRLRREKRERPPDARSPAEFAPPASDPAAVAPPPSVRPAAVAPEVKTGRLEGPSPAVRGPATTALFAAALCVAFVLAADLIEFTLSLYLDSPTLEYLQKLLARHWREADYGLPFLARYLGAGSALAGVLYLLLLAGWRRAAVAVLSLSAGLGVLYFFARGSIYAVMRVQLSGDLIAYILENGALVFQAEGAENVSGRVPWSLWVYLLLMLLPPLGFLLRPLLLGGASREAQGPRWHHGLATLAVFTLSALLGFGGGDSLAGGFAPGDTVDPGRDVRSSDLSLPPESAAAPARYAYRNAFRERYGFRLRPGTDVVVLMLESARAAYVPLEKTRYFRPGDPRVVAVEDFFVPIPHSSNTHFSFFTGEHSARKASDAYDTILLERSLPGLLAREGYAAHYLYGGPARFDREDRMLDRLGMRVVDLRDFKQRRDANGKRYERFWWGVDDRALVDETRGILERETKPLFLTVVYTNSHHSYFNPRPDIYHEHDNETDVGRHRNAIRYALDLSDEIVELFREHGRGDALFVLLSDHGESFGEHGFIMHDFSLYNTEVKVPYVMRHPDFRRLFDRPRFQAGTVLDVYPTVADLFGLPFEGEIHGRTLFAPDYHLRLLLRSWNTDDYVGLIDGRTKWLYARPRRELMRMTRADGEVANVPLDARARAFVDALYAQEFGDTSPVGKKDDDEEEEEHEAGEASEERNDERGPEESREREPN